jgi:hypothetical protein
VKLSFGMSSIPGPLKQTAKFSFTRKRQYSMSPKIDSKIDLRKRNLSWAIEHGVSSCAVTCKNKKFKMQIEAYYW